VRHLINDYLDNAEILAESLRSSGLDVFGGRNAPYIWVAVPPGYSSWQVFDKMLQDIQVVITPGVGFGAQGEGYFRVSAFNSRENVREVGRRFKEVNW
jgi:LL-diaminopimelate aminotransferase